MANLVTLDDLPSEEILPNRRPLPNPWTSAKRLDDSQEMNASFQSYGMDGKIRTFTSNEALNRGKLILMSCFPCFPLRLPGREREFLNLILMFCFWISFLQIVMFVASLCVYPPGFASLEENPFIGPSGYSLVILGAKYNEDMQNKNQFWRFLTPIFLHVGLIHLFMNLWMQLQKGVQLEAKWGILKTSSVYFVSGISGILMSCLCNPKGVSVGASGSLLGLIGSDLTQRYLTWHETSEKEKKQTFTLAISVMIIMILSFAPFIDVWAHFGGFMTGGLCGIIMFSSSSNQPIILKYGTLTSGVLLLLWFFVGFATFYTNKV
eukprot:TRINITY_DN1365_c1_g1_i1.p1 TRINITY_DN1365_c1_g1~~TRINITY_DN1365_c1_g1_i1.p1  ORF type:complete len:321 (-),score=68.03 TRINITY_DN1365_c1_g1_i1:263-1225(-)